MRVSLARVPVTAHCHRHLAPCDGQRGKENISDACHVVLVGATGLQSCLVLSMRGVGAGETGG